MTMSLSPLKISLLTINQWQSYVESQTNSSIFHHRNWLELLSEQYGFEIRIPALIVDRKIRAAIPLLQTQNLRSKKKLISLPFTDYLPVLSADGLATDELCQLINQEYQEKFETVVIRADETVAGLEHQSQHVRHELATDFPMEKIETSFASPIRRNLRKSERQDLVFHKRSDIEAINIFYRLHVLTRKKLGVPVQSKKYFLGFYEKLIKSGLGYLGVVSKQNVPIAAVVLLGFNGRLVYKYAASDPTALEHRPNDWLVYNAIRLASEEGYRFFDFGITGKNQHGLRRFKSKWGAAESEIFYSYIVGQPNIDDGQSRAMQFASVVIKRSPTLVCRALGKAFYKYSQ